MWLNNLTYKIALPGVIQGFQRVGDASKGINLSGNLQAELVVICTGINCTFLNEFCCYYFDLFYSQSDFLLLFAI